MMVRMMLAPIDQVASLSVVVQVVATSGQLLVAPGVRRATGARADLCLVGVVVLVVVVVVLVRMVMMVAAVGLVEGVRTCVVAVLVVAGWRSARRRIVGRRLVEGLLLVRRG